jgi:hypothetical protein
MNFQTSFFFVSNEEVAMIKPWHDKLSELILVCGNKEDAMVKPWRDVPSEKKSYRRSKITPMVNRKQP